MKGRPKKADKDRRGSIITFRISETERERFDVLCKDLELQRSEILRRSVNAIWERKIRMGSAK